MEPFMDLDELNQLMATAECLFTQTQVEAALAALVPAVTADYEYKNPLVLGIMNGALVTLGFLLPRLKFPLQQDYLHATRYGGDEEGGDLRWKVRPETPIENRHVLLVDDILDRGITLASVRDYCLSQGAASVKVLVLGQKHIPNFSPSISADYCALHFPNRYVFGYGMDYQNYWRNAPGIFAC